MVKPEYSYERDLSYSQWHRTLSSSCYVMNLDWVEIRKRNDKTKIVAIIEEKDDRANRVNEWRKSIFLQIANALQVPAYIVYHNACRRLDHRHLWRFKIHNLIDNSEQTLNETQYRVWLEEI